MRQWSGSLELPPDGRACAASREFVSQALARYGHGSLLDVALLAVTELASNALRHGLPPYRVGVSVDDDAVEVHVFDTEAACPTPGAGADPLAESGRGLAIVQAVSSRWGCRPRPGGKEVWFELVPPLPLPLG